MVWEMMAWVILGHRKTVVKSKPSVEDFGLRCWLFWVDFESRRFVCHVYGSLDVLYTWYKCKNVRDIAWRREDCIGMTIAIRCADVMHVCCDICSSSSISFLFYFLSEFSFHACPICYLVDFRLLPLVSFDC